MVLPSQEHWDHGHSPGWSACAGPQRSSMRDPAATCTSKPMNMRKQEMNIKKRHILKKYWSLVPGTIYGAGQCCAIFVPSSWWSKIEPWLSILCCDLDGFEVCLLGLGSILLSWPTDGSHKGPKCMPSWLSTLWTYSQKAWLLVLLVLWPWLWPLLLLLMHWKLDWLLCWVGVKQMPWTYLSMVHPDMVCHSGPRNWTMHHSPCGSQ